MHTTSTRIFTRSLRRTIAATLIGASSLAVVVPAFSAPAHAARVSKAVSATTAKTQIIELIGRIGAREGLSSALVARLQADLRALSLSQLKDLAAGRDYSRLGRLVAGLPSSGSLPGNALDAARGAAGAGSATQQAISGATSKTGGFVDPRSFARDGETVGDGAEDADTADSKAREFDKAIGEQYDAMTGKGMDPAWVPKDRGHDRVSDGSAAYELASMIWATIRAYQQTYGGKGEPRPDADAPSGVITVADVNAALGRANFRKLTNPEAAGGGSAAGGVKAGTTQTAGQFTDLRVGTRVDVSTALRAIRVLVEWKFQSAGL